MFKSKAQNPSQALLPHLAPMKGCASGPAGCHSQVSESSIKADEAQRNHAALPEDNDGISDVFHLSRFSLDGLGDAAAGV